MTKLPIDKSIRYSGVTFNLVQRASLAKSKKL